MTEDIETTAATKEMPSHTTRQTISTACELCGRVTKKGTTAHHLIPRKCHSNKWFRKRFDREQMRQTADLCRDCHSAIHKFVPEHKDLGRDYNSIENLLGHPEISRYVEWVKKQK